MRIVETAFDDEVAQRLVADLQGEYARRYGTPDETPLEVEHFVRPTGAFFVGWLDGEAVATGGWRLRPDVQGLGGTRAAEVKRMYVVPAVQRRGLARAMLAHLEETARAAGADLVVVETGMKQPEAIALYESSGYEPVTPFGVYRDSPLVRCFGRRL